MKKNLSVKTPAWSNWVLVPLRVFLGLTFVYAGLQKLTDPQFFNPHAVGYIGNQLTNMGDGTPLQSFLANVAAPHAPLFGALVAYGELAIGLGVLAGLFLRIASLFGLLLSLIFFLSSSWLVFPYFYGSDIVFVFCWLTLLLAGPANQALPAIDTWLAMRLVEKAPPQQQLRRSALCALLLGVETGPAPVPLTRKAPTQPERRLLLRTIIISGAALLAAGWLGEILHLLPPGSTSSKATNLPQVVPSNDTPDADSTPTSDPAFPGEPTPAEGTPATTSSSTIATISQVPTNSAIEFDLPDDQPGILIHLDDGQFVAFNATCKHKQCPVHYKTATKKLVCPCHGAIYDPAAGARVISGPAPSALDKLNIKVDTATGNITLLKD